MKSAVLLCIGVVSVCQSEPFWEITNPRPLAGDVCSIDSPAPDTIWAANDAATLVCSVNGGQTWNIIDLPVDINGKLLVDFISGCSGFILATNNTSTPFGAVALRTENSGADWTVWEVGNQEDPFVATALTVNGATALIGGFSPGIRNSAIVNRLTNNNWSGAFLPGDQVETLNNLSLFNQNLGWAVADNGYLASTSDGGRTWQRVPTQLQTDLFSVLYTSPTTGLIGGGDFNTGNLYKTSNGGASWQEVQNLDVDAKFVKLQALQGTGVATISRGGGDADLSHLIVSTDGRNWNTIASWERQLLSSLSFFGQSIWIGGDKGFIARSIDGNAPELISQRATTNNLTDISFSQGSIGWAIGGLGTVLKSYDGGSNWQKIENFPFMEPIAVISFNQWRTIVSCRGSREMISNDGGESWHEIAISDENVTAFEKAGEAIFAVAGNTVSVSQNNVESWTSTEVRPGGTILSVNPVSNQIAYATVLRDSVFTTIDGGETWQPSLIFPPNTRALAIIDSVTFRAAVETVNGTTIWSTDNNWRNRERLNTLNYDVIDIKYFNRSNGFVLGNGGEFSRLSRDSGEELPSGLRTSNIIQHIEQLQDWVWVCGEGGFIGRWGENWLGVEDNPSETLPMKHQLLCIWPNPTNGRVNFRFDSFQTEIIDLYSPDGRKVLEFNSPKYGEVISLNLENLRSGVYFVRDRHAFSTSTPILLLK